MPGIFTQVLKLYLVFKNLILSYVHCILCLTWYSGPKTGSSFNELDTKFLTSVYCAWNFYSRPQTGSKFQELDTKFLCIVYCAWKSYSGPKLDLVSMNLILSSCTLYIVPRIRSEVL